jgi:MFS family permease
MNAYENNIRISYALSIIRNSYFWWAVWLLYYLQFVDYTGVGVLESIHLFALLFTEIPTGAIADLLGKKKSLIIAFSLISVGNLIMGLAQDMSFLVISVVVITLGDAFNSGAFEALVYDSLIELKQRKKYQTILARISSIGSATIAVVSILGGILYMIDFRLPFFMTSLVSGVGALLCFWLTEPSIDSEKVNVRLALKQSFQGIHNLVNKRLIKQTVGLLFIGFVLVAGFELIDDVIVVELGYNPSQLGFIYASFGIVAAISAQLVPRVTKRIGNMRSILGAAFLLGLSFILTPLVGIVLTTGFVIMRVISTVLIENTSSVIINNNTPSKDRATTLSTFNMLRQLPFAILASFIGGLILKWTVFYVAAGIGLLTLLVVIIYWAYLKISKSDLIQV